MNDTHSLSPRRPRPSPFRMLRLAPLALIGVAVLGAGGCSVTPDTPSPSGPSCDTDGTVACTDGIGYSCTGDDAPQDSDSSLICSSGSAGNAGSTLYCCLQLVKGTCGPDDTVAGCAPGSFGFSCSDATEPPNDSYPSLQCSSPTQGNAGSAIYCCTD